MSSIIDGVAQFFSPTHLLATAALAGCVTESVMSAAGVFEYARGIDGLAGVAPWLPGLYFAFGVVAARLGELCATWRPAPPP